MGTTRPRKLVEPKTSGGLLYNKSRINTLAIQVPGGKDLAEEWMNEP
jgi:hypothetical protein